MGENSKIAWTTHTFNPWVGCQRISSGCTNCYAEAYDRRVGGDPSARLLTPPEMKDGRVPVLRWGPKAPRTRTSAANWRKPLAWNRAAEKAGVRHRVFCASLADVFEDRPELVRWRAELFELIARTPFLDWLLLTKRPQAITPLLRSTLAFFETNGGWLCDAAIVLRLWLDGVGNDGTPLPPSNVWLGTTVEDQQRADERIPALLAVPAAVRFLSCEPLLERVDLTFGKHNRPGLLWKTCPTCEGSMSVPVPGGGKACPTCFPSKPGVGEQGLVNAGIDWVIIGGESGPAARPFDLDWARDLVRQCRSAGVAPFVKQLGACAWEDMHLGPPGYGMRRLRLTDPAGANPDEWPEDLRVREFPR